MTTLLFPNICANVTCSEEMTVQWNLGWGELILEGKIKSCKSAVTIAIFFSLDSA